MTGRLTRGAVALAEQAQVCRAGRSRAEVRDTGHELTMARGCAAGVELAQAMTLAPPGVRVANARAMVRGVRPAVAATSPKSTGASKTGATGWAWTPVEAARASVRRTQVLAVLTQNNDNGRGRGVRWRIVVPFQPSRSRYCFSLSPLNARRPLTGSVQALDGCQSDLAMQAVSTEDQPGPGREATDVPMTAAPSRELVRTYFPGARSENEGPLRR